MTNTQAVKADIMPYTADVTTIEKAIVDNGLFPDDIYTDRTAIAVVSISVLKCFLAVASESEGGFTQSYDRKGLESRIAQLERVNGLAGSVGNTVRNKSSIW